MNKYGIILGAASGIGNACYKEVVKNYNDYKFILVDKTTIKVREQDSFLNCDLSKRNDVEVILDLIQKIDGSIVFLINSVGYQEDIDIFNLNHEDMFNMYESTVFSIFDIEQKVAMKMIEKKSDNQAIVNITSIHASIIREIANYSSSKAALTMISKELAYKVAENGIRVNCIEPGSTDTPLLRKSLNTEELMKEGAENIPMKRHGEAKEVADLAVFLISDKSKYITGVSIPCDGGLSLII